MNDEMLRCIAGLVYPVRAVCMGCLDASGHERGWLCDECREKLARSWVGAAPAPGDCGMEGSAFAYSYAGPAGGIVRNMKYRGVWRLGSFMAGDMMRALDTIEPVRVDMVVPVPMHWLRKRMRDYNQAEVLAALIAEMKGVEYCCALRRVRLTVQQARLSGEARRNNLEQAIEVAEDVAGKRILLVDDVCTTGATAAACEQALRQAGAKHVFLLCYALAKDQ